MVWSSRVLEEQQLQSNRRVVPAEMIDDPQVVQDHHLHHRPVEEIILSVG